MPLIREGKPFFIYALVCPLTLQVKYVGQTLDLEQRTRGREHHGSGKHNAPLAQWLRSLGYLRPYRVILEQGINRPVEVTATAVDLAHVRGRRRIVGVRATWLSSCLEAKWIKRFRRTIVNKNKTGEYGAYQALVNPPLPWGNDSDVPAERLIPPQKAGKDARGRFRSLKHPSSGPAHNENAPQLR